MRANLNTLLKKQRLQAGLTVADAAAESRTPVRTWYAWEAGGKSMRTPPGIAFAWLALFQKNRPPTTKCTLIKKYQKLTGKKAAETFCRTHNGAREMVSSRLARVALQIERDGQAGTGTLNRKLPGGVKVGDLI